MTPFTQEDFACRCEWGPDAVTALAPAEVIIVIDVFSFTTCVDVAVSRGVAILPISEAAVEATRTPGSEIDGSVVAGSTRGARGRWVQLRRRRSQPEADVESPQISQPETAGA